MKHAKWVLAVLIVLGVAFLCFGCKDVPQTVTSIPLGQTELVQHSKGNADIRLEIPAGWEYEIQDEQGVDSFCIAFWPAEQKKGKIEVWYNAAFGVCGTGLTQQTVTIGKYKAQQGTYDGQRMFYYIGFIDTYRDYVIINEGAEAWPDEQITIARRILNTLTLGSSK